MVEAARAASEQQRNTRNVGLIEQEVGPTELRWTEDAALWGTMYKARYASQGKGLARLFVLFTRAFVAVVVSHRGDPDFRASCEKMIAEWVDARGPDPSARVPLRAVIKSLRFCGKGAFLHTLYTLSWAGHIRTMASFNALRFVFNATVTLCFEDLDYFGQDGDGYVRTDYPG